MGVNGLWTVVQPCARPTNLATLNRKRLAVDASIWIYQFLKAVRDKEGNALRNSHVVGFFRRICKLLWFGIQPVFVFDGGAPALKRATIQMRHRRREGRREDAVKTAGKLLAVQMQRIAEEENEKRMREKGRGVSGREPVERPEELPDMNTVVYADEFGMSQKERQQTRTFRKQDQYHLPELDGIIANMGKPEDPRIMSVEELEEYAQQFHNGEDVNLYDFSKIDFDGDFFKSLPPPDRYNILNAARLRSRLRMGLSKEQLDDMFPDRMAFSRFQIERVKERNHLTQRLMKEAGMTGLDLTIGGSGRVAGEKDREYILVKNEGVEGGWALGVVSKEKDVGEAHKPIDVDAIQIQYASKDAEDEDDGAEFEDVPIEGVNRLPKLSQSANATRAREPLHNDNQGHAGEESLFVGGFSENANNLFLDQTDQRLHPSDEEEDDISKAIALSLRTQHGVGQAEGLEEEEFEDVRAPEWTQRRAEAARPIQGTDSGSIIAHIVNNRASAAVPKNREKPSGDSDSEDDMQAVLAKARKTRMQQAKPLVENKKNPFDGPLPFPKLSFGSSIFAKKDTSKTSTPRSKDCLLLHNDLGDKDSVDDMAGGFERHEEGDTLKPLPPWMEDHTDIRESLKKQQSFDRHFNAEDKAQAEEEARLRRRGMRDAMIEIDSSSDDENDIEILEKPHSPPKKSQETLLLKSDQIAEKTASSNELPDSPNMNSSVSKSDTGLATYAQLDSIKLQGAGEFKDITEKASKSPEPVVEEVRLSKVPREAQPEPSEQRHKTLSPEPEFEDVTPTVTLTLESHAPPVNDISGPATQNPTAGINDDHLFDDVEYDEFSDPGDEELLAQMAEEAEEHARFASELNKKPAQQNKEDYEKELRQLRNQQKKDRRDADEVTQVMVSECQALLRLFGIPYITAPMEAEAQCAELVKLGLVDGIVTDDSDTFLFGGTRVYKNMFNSNKFVECYIASDLEKELSLSREQLISLAQLLGSDYTEGLIGVGPVTAVEILSEFPGKSGLDDFRSWWLSVQSQSHPKEVDASSSFRKKFRKSQGTKLFLPTGFPSAAVYDAYLYPEINPSAESFQWGVPDLEGLRRFLMATIGWSKERTDEVLVPVIRDMNKRDAEGTQSNITRFFGGGVGVGAKDAFAPRERVKGSKRMAAAVDKLRSKVSGDQAAESSGSTSKRKRGKRQESIIIDEDEEDVEQRGSEASASTSSRTRGRGKRTKAL